MHICHIRIQCIFPTILFIKFDNEVRKPLSSYMSESVHKIVTFKVEENPSLLCQDMYKVIIYIENSMCYLILDYVDSLFLNR